MLERRIIMKRTYVVLCLFLSVCVSTYAQTDFKKDSMMLDKNSARKLPELKMASSQPSRSVVEFRIPNEMKRKNSQLDFMKPNVMTLKIDKLKDISSPYYSMPKLNPLVSTSFNYNAGLMDYNNSQMRMFNKRSALLMQGSSANYIGMGVANKMGIDYLFKPTNRWVVGVGSNAVKYSNMSGTFNDVVFKANSSYAVADWLTLDVFGQYAVNASRNQKASMLYSPFAPQTNYGSAVTLKLSDTFGVQVGVVREFNVMKRKWETYPTFTPVFYK